MARRQADLEAFASEQGPALQRLAFLLTGGNPEEAEDIVSAVMARMVERGLDGLDNPVAYARPGRRQRAQFSPPPPPYGSPVGLSALYRAWSGRPSA